MTDYEIVQVGKKLEDLDKDLLLKVAETSKANAMKALLDSAEYNEEAAKVAYYTNKAYQHFFSTMDAMIQDGKNTEYTIKERTE